MKADILSRTDLLFLAEFSVVLFVAVFVGAALWAFRSGAKAEYQARAYLPLDDGEITPEGPHGA